MITIDAGTKKNCGYAVFKGKELAWANVFSVEEVMLHASSEPGELVVIEVPRFYQHDHKDPNDLIDLAVNVGQFKRHFELQRCRVKLIWPRSWKGNIAKELMTKRILGKLTVYELARMPVRPRARTHDHNMVDAVGIGLVEVGRMRA